MKRLVLVILLISLVAMTSCGFSPDRSSLTTDYFKGTEGITLEFLDQAPPSSVFEGSEFDLQGVISNKGSTDVADNYVVTVELVYDTVDINEVTYNSPFADQYLSAKGPVQLHGKSYYYPDGEQNYILFDRFEAKQIPGNFEQSLVSFYVALCYPYRTFFSDQICVDTDTENLNLRDEVCQKEDRSYTGGQGAPVAITRVESNMVPIGAYVQPQFLLTVRHMGDGFVSMYNTQVYEQGLLGCGETNSSSINTASIAATLGSEELLCRPNPILFKNGEAKVECILDRASILTSTFNYWTTLNVEVAYLYTDVYKRNLNIKKAHSTNFGDQRNTDDEDYFCPPWQIYMKTQDNCVDRCDYCSDNPSDSQCLIEDTMFGSSNPKKMTVDHACSYKTLEDCREAGDYCIQDNNLCAFGSYCGIPECLMKADKNAKPKILFDSKTAGDQLRWVCQDKDDIDDAQQTCGCEENAGIAYVDEDESCFTLP